MFKNKEYIFMEKESNSNDYICHALLVDLLDIIIGKWIVFKHNLIHKDNKWYFYKMEESK